MDENIVLYITLTITSLGVTGGLLTGWWLWLRARTERLRGKPTEEIRELQDSVSRLRNDLDAMYGELMAGQQEIHERLDFAERLLTKGRDDAGRRD
jgi:hypothetical protein